MSNKKANDIKSSLIGSFYDKYPFSKHSLLETIKPNKYWNWSYENISSLCFGASYKNKFSKVPLKILDAGCGSGFSTNYLAHLNPGSEILAIDVSLKSIEVARERLKISGGNNIAKISFKNISLYDIDDTQKFDFVNLYGVLDHLGNPCEGLKKISTLLKNDGLIYIYINSFKGRYEIQRVKDVLNLLSFQPDSQDIFQSRELISRFSNKNRIFSYIKENHFNHLNDANFADLYLHPFENSFELTSIFDIIKLAKLNFISFSDPYFWNVNRLLEGSLLEKAKSLNNFDQWRLIESLDPNIMSFEMFLAKGQVSNFLKTKDSDLVKARCSINPSLQVSPDACLFFDNKKLFEVSKDCFEVLKVIEDNPGIPLLELPFSMTSELLARTIRKMVRNRILLLFPFG
tara:strand:- start:3706 stop:4911 length:1206 start_codon:yes stop_codon:yes gene_type:complete